jgi:hypothetical protein
VGVEVGIAPVLREAVARTPFAEASDLDRAIIEWHGAELLLPQVIKQLLLANPLLVGLLDLLAQLRLIAPGTRYAAAKWVLL